MPRPEFSGFWHFFVINPIIKPFKIPANIFNDGMDISRCIRREHGAAVVEACKGYGEILSKGFKDKLELITVLAD